MDTYTVISAFSGIGGLDLGVSAAIPTRTIAYIEREITCAKILAQRAAEGLLDDAPIYSDVKTFPTELFAGKVDIDFLLSGFPCQPFSVAGRQKGSGDERNLWPDTLRLIRSLRPRYAFMENVSGLVAHEYFGTILRDLAEAGYDAEWGCFTASEIGASHRRERVFILAYSKLDRDRGGSQGFQQEDRAGGTASTTQIERSGSELAHANNSGSLAPEHGIDRHGQKEDKGWDGQPFPEPSGQGNELAHANRPELPEFPPGPGDSRWGWIIEHYPELSPALCKLHEAEPTLCNMDDAGKITDRVAGLMMLGNAVVPQQAEHAFRTLASRINDAG